MVPGREDVIVGGALILAVVMTRFGLDECLVSEADILDGMAAGLLRLNGARPAGPGPRRLRLRSAPGWGAVRGRSRPCRRAEGRPGTGRVGGRC